MASCCRLIIVAYFDFASTQGKRQRVGVKLTAWPPGERLGMGERRRVGVELTSRPPPGERLSLGGCRAGILIARIDVDWWEGGLTSPGVRDLRSWRLVHSSAKNDSGHPSPNSSSIFCCRLSRSRRISSPIATMWGGGGGGGGGVTMIGYTTIKWSRW